MIDKPIINIINEHELITTNEKLFVFNSIVNAIIKTEIIIDSIIINSAFDMSRIICSIIFANMNSKMNKIEVIEITAIVVLIMILLICFNYSSPNLYHNV